MTTTDHLKENNDDVVWGYKATNEKKDPNGTMVELSSKPKGTDVEKESLRKAIDIRARNQVVRAILAEALDPDFYTTTITKATNQALLLVTDPDNFNKPLIDGTMLLLLIAKQICPSIISLVDNLKKEAASMKLKDFKHDVTATICRFEELHARIESHGKTWDGALKSLFQILLSTEDDQFQTAITSKNNEYLAGTLTQVSELVKHATAIYTNLKSEGKWMVPDQKSVKIAALTTRIETLQAQLSTSVHMTADTLQSKEKESKKGFNACDPWRFKYTGKDHVEKDGKDYYWCSDESHKRMPGCTEGLYCTTHGNGHPTHPTHASWIKWKKDNPYGKRNSKAGSDKPNGTNSTGSSGSGTAISLNDRLKSALLTRTSCTAADLESLEGSNF